MSTFAPTHIEYYETAAIPYVWAVRYDLAFNGKAVDVDLAIRLTGADAGAGRIEQWDRGISEIWNDKVFLSDGHKLLELRIDSSFVDAGEDQLVHVLAGTGRGDMTDWYVTTEWGEAYVDEFAAHEFGHMLGAFDEYDGGATANGYTTSGSLMSDFTVAGAKNFTRYVDGIRLQTESLSGEQLQAQLSILGDSGAQSLAGTGAMDGFYALGGADTVDGRGGNDFLDGGGGRDSLVGGGGHDILKGGTGADRFVFTLAAASSSDQVRDFHPGEDLLVFQRDAFTEAGRLGTPALARYFEGPDVDAAGATDAAQRFLYDTTSGKLWYDPDGSDPAAKMLVATLAGHPDISAADIRII